MPIESRRAESGKLRCPCSPVPDVPSRDSLSGLHSPPLFPSLSLSLYLSLFLSLSITNDRAAPEGQRQSCRLRRTSSAVIPRPVDRPVSHGLKRSVEVLIRVSDRVPRPLITEPDLIRCPPVRRFPLLEGRSRDAKPQRRRRRRRGCFKSPVRFKPFDERPADNRREFAARSNESRLNFIPSSVEETAMILSVNLKFRLLCRMLLYNV